MIIATASISGSAMTRMPMMVAMNHAQSYSMPQRTNVSVMRAPVPLRRQGSSSRRKESGLLPSQEHSPVSSLRRLLVVQALDQLVGAQPHRRAVAADRVGQEEVLDRVADRALRL